MMNNSIYPCLWFDGNAKEAATFYCNTFRHSKIVSENPMVVIFHLEDMKFMALNGGAQFKPSAATSFFITFEDAGVLNKTWDTLSEGGFVFMPLDKYDWSERYGWVQDKFGISWQLALGDIKNTGDNFVPTFLFCGEHQGQAEQAINFYTSLFKNSSITGILKYESGATKGQIMHAQFNLNGKVFMAMDSGVPQPFTFTEGISNVIECDTQKEIDYFWNAFTQEGEESMCGWCKDQFGVWWQVIPSNLGQLMGDPSRAEKVTAAFMKMKKFDIAALENA